MIPDLQRKSLVELELRGRFLFSFRAVCILTGGALLGPTLPAWSAAQTRLDTVCPYSHSVKSKVQAAWLELDNCRLYYEIEGKGSPLVTVHGGVHHGIFHPILTSLAARHQVVYYDRRGFGRTRVELQQPEVASDLDVQDLEHLRAHLGHERISLLAYSAGGPVVLEYARRYPRNVEKIVLVSTYADEEDRVGLAWEPVKKILDDPGRQRQLKELAGREGVDDLSRRIAEFEILPHIHHQVPIPRPIVKDWFQDGCLDTKGDRQQARYRSRLSRSYAGMNFLGEIRHPVLIVCGRQDAITPLAHSRKIVPFFPNARLFIIEQAGHLAFAEYPDQFNDEVLRFLANAKAITAPEHRDRQQHF